MQITTSIGKCEMYKWNSTNLHKSFAQHSAITIRVLKHSPVFICGARNLLYIRAIPLFYDIFNMNLLTCSSSIFTFVLLFEPPWGFSIYEIKMFISLNLSHNRNNYLSVKYKNYYHKDVICTLNIMKGIQEVYKFTCDFYDFETSIKCQHWKN